MPLPIKKDGESKDQFIQRFMSDLKMIEEYPDESQRRAIAEEQFSKNKAVYNIPIRGLIGSPEDKNDKNIYFQYTDLLMHLNASQDYGVLNLDIASDGGYTDVADRMCDTLMATGKIITSCNSGNVCSAASKLFTLAPKGSRVFYPNRGQFLIHNPWTEITGDSTELAQASKELKSIENSYAEWYAERTGANVDIIKQFMAENIPLTPEQIETLGFATIVKTEIKAVAKFNLNNMDNKEVLEKLSGIEKIVSDFKTWAKKTFKPKALMLNDANGAELDFPDIADISELKEGIAVMQNGTPANGDFTLPDGTVLKAENGVLTAITPPAAGELEQLKQELAALKAENETLKAEKTKAETSTTEAVAMFKKVESEFTKFKAQFTNYTPDPNLTGGNKKNILTKEQVEKM